MITRRTALGLLATAFVPGLARTAFAESDYLKPKVEAGELPAVAERMPKTPRIINTAALGGVPGVQGGTARMLIGGQRDVRLMPINSYSRLVGYDRDLKLQADILESFTVEEERIFTFRLREGHKWSSGEPFTADDFRYCWEEVILNRELFKGGPPVDLLVEGKPPTFEMIDPLTVRYRWEKPIPDFLPKLAAPIPLVLALPSAYMRQFHKKFQAADVLEKHIQKQRVDDWRGLHIKMSRQNRPENPDLPTLEAWRPRTAPPAEQFIFDRNPFFHRVDENGVQLPYIDRVVMNVSSPDLISAKTATGESDLQIANLDFADYTLLKEAETIYPLNVVLWKRTLGSRVALIPNLNCGDKGWQKVLRDVRVRRAMSLAINRTEINKAVFYGLGQESANTVLPDSPLFKQDYAKAWASYDPDQANRLLDEAGLDKRDDEGLRLLPDGRSAHLVVESAGESTLETDVLELITDHFRTVGLGLFVRTSQRDIFRSRAIGGEVIMSVWYGLDNGVPTPEMSPSELAPTSDDQYQWPVWGMYFATVKTKGEPPDMPEVQYLVDKYDAWQMTTTDDERTAIWHEMLAHHADQVFTIGTVNGISQPVVRARRMRNVPDKALCGFNPTSFLGVYMPDTFWYEGGA
ncbi:ABC transporter substrate-binding protein [Shinella kummerowiae]|uniref:ABC transporter substrate-binding protein n=1 Tax=Shinella kummerowiae TaxID=417745 RepID=A0A6N8SC06_9HYPH|nr:ABC transporter substrate-binding protein [Shinella kummerowiae]MXN46624.1 ABC transporter substrate-binding protein [Shinella kummerowiae]